MIVEMPKNAIRGRDQFADVLFRQYLVHRRAADANLILRDPLKSKLPMNLTDDGVL